MDHLVRHRVAQVALFFFKEVLGNLNHCRTRHAQEPDASARDEPSGRRA
jgi:hypothetical protein